MLIASYKRNLSIVGKLVAIALLASLLIQISLTSAPIYQNALLTFNNLGSMVSSILLLSAFLLSLTLPYWLKSIEDDREEFYLLLLLTTIGSLIVCNANHFASFFLGLELMGVSLVPLIAYRQHCRRSLEAGVKYLILSSVASAFILMSMALLYLYSGNLSLIDLSKTISSGLQSTHDVDVFTLSTAGVLLLLGLSFKLSLVPSHLWAADVFEGAPLPANALLATLSKVSVFIVFLRVFSADGFTQNTALFEILTLIACASMLIGNLLGLFQNNIRRLLAYSSIAHFGYMLIAVLALASINHVSMVIEGTVMYLLAYSVASVGIFSLLMLLPNINKVDDLKGLLWTKPVIASVLIFLFLSMAGIPLTIGFIGKFYLAFIAINNQYWLMLISLFAGSLLGVFYYLRVILALISQDQPESFVGHEKTISDKLGHGLAIIIIAALIIGLGVLPNTVINTITGSL